MLNKIISVSALKDAAGLSIGNVGSKLVQNKVVPVIPGLKDNVDLSYKVGPAISLVIGQFLRSAKGGSLVHKIGDGMVAEAGGSYLARLVDRNGTLLGNVLMGGDPVMMGMPAGGYDTPGMGAYAQTPGGQQFHSAEGSEAGY